MDKKVRVKELTYEAFRIYGSFAKMLEPKGLKLGGGPIEFFPDLGILNLGQTMAVGFSGLTIKKREYIITDLECHMYTGEGTIPLNGDILMHVAPGTPKEMIPLDQIEVFRVPKGTLVTLRPGVWHSAPYTDNTDSVNVVVILPERTYVNDAYFYHIPDENQIRIVES